MWAIKDKTIGTTFFDEGAARFFLCSSVKKPEGGVEGRKAPVKDQRGRTEEDGVVASVKRMQYMLDPTGAYPSLACPSPYFPYCAVHDCTSIGLACETKATPH